MLKEKQEKMIIIEGLWGSRKTTLCRYLEKHYNFYFIQEPNHIKAGLNKKPKRIIVNWYLKEHFKNLILGFQIIKNGKNVVIERSPISSIAFAKTRSETYFSYKNKFMTLQKLLLKNNSKIRPLLIFLKPKNINSLSYYLNNSRNKNIQIYSNKEFLANLEKNLSHFLDRLYKKKLVNLITVKVNKSLVKNFRNIIPKIL